MTIAEARQPVLVGRGPGRITLGVRGALEGNALVALREATSAAIEPGLDLIVDLHEVTSMGAEGIAVLSAAKDRAVQAEGSFLIRPPAAGIGDDDELDALGMTPYELARRAHPAGRRR